MTDPAEELRRLATLRPVDVLHEDDGDVLLWRFDRRAKPFTMVGDREDVDWWYCPNDRPTHWSPIPKVEAPSDASNPVAPETQAVECADGGRGLPDL